MIPTALESVTLAPDVDLSFGGGKRMPAGNIFTVGEQYKLELREGGYVRIETPQPKEVRFVPLGQVVHMTPASPNA
jgi:hypothetical protein